MSTNIQALAEMEKEFLLPDAVDGGDFTRDELAEDMSDIQISFPRVKIPSGGIVFFEVPGEDPENPEAERTLEGIIVYNNMENAYWSGEDSDDKNAPPDCMAVDARTGAGDPGGLCDDCALNEFGSGKDGKGKACKNMRYLYLLRSGEFIPLLLILPPTSLKPFKEFYTKSFSLRQRAIYGSVVSIGLKKENNGKDDYSVATFTRLYDFTGEQLAKVKAYAKSFREQINIINQQRAANAMSGAESCDDGDDYGEFSGVGSFSVSDIEANGIDGDREDIPA